MTIVFGEYVQITFRENQIRLSKSGGEAIHYGDIAVNHQRGKD
jgi:hypothetical protein